MIASAVGSTLHGVWKGLPGLFGHLAPQRSRETGPVTLANSCISSRIVPPPSFNLTYFDLKKSWS
jgi:hypothetical protein